MAVNVELSHHIAQAEQTSPSFLYNMAVLEAFQRNARRATFPEGHVDHDHEVILLGGSFGKGTGHFWSDLDVIDVTQSNERSLEWIYRYIKYMPEEFDRLMTEPRFRNVANYIAIAKEIQLRSIKKRHQAVTSISLAGIRYDSRYSSPEEYEDFIYEFALPGEFGHLSSQMDSSVKRDRRKPRLAERFSKRVHIPNAPIPVFPHTVSTKKIENAYEPGSTTMDNIQAGISDVQTAIDHPELLLTVFHVLTATAGIDAFEVTEGNLAFHQKNILQTLRSVYKQKPRYQNFKEFENKLVEAWWDYQEHTKVKYGSLYWDFKKNRQGNAFVFHPILDEPALPTFREFERLIERKKKI